MSFNKNQYLGFCLTVDKINSFSSQEAYSHILISTYSHIHIFTYSHIYIFSYSHILIFTFSYSHILIFTYVHLAPAQVYLVSEAFAVLHSVLQLLIEIHDPPLGNVSLVFLLSLGLEWLNDCS